MSSRCRLTLPRLIRASAREFGPMWRSSDWTCVSLVGGNRLTLVRGSEMGKYPKGDLAKATPSPQIDVEGDLGTNLVSRPGGVLRGGREVAKMAAPGDGEVRSGRTVAEEVVPRQVMLSTSGYFES